MQSNHDTQQIVSSFIHGTLKLRVNYERLDYGQNYHFIIDTSISLTLPRDILLMSPILLEQIATILTQFL